MCVFITKTLHSSLPFLFAQLTFIHPPNVNWCVTSSDRLPPLPCLFLCTLSSQQFCQLTFYFCLCEYWIICLSLPLNCKLCEVGSILCFAYHPWHVVSAQETLVNEWIGLQHHSEEMIPICTLTHRNTYLWKPRISHFLGQIFLLHFPVNEVGFPS